MKKTNNKGFSLVELIVVIAIMAVLVGVAAPTFTKYVEQSRRSTDIQNAEAIKTAMLAAMADGEITADGTGVTVGKTSPAVCPTALEEVPTIQGSIDKDDPFTMDYDAVAGTCKVYASGYELTNASDAGDYKTATAAKPATP